MKRMIVASLVFLALFGLSAAGSWFYLQNQIAQQTEDAANEESSDSADDQPVEPFDPDPDLLMPLRPGDLNAEALLQMAASIKHREESLRNNEETLKQQRTRLEFVFQDLQQEQAELDALHDKISATVADASQLLDQVRNEKTELKMERSQAKTDLAAYDVQRKEFDAKELEKIARLADLYKEMPVETSARYLREWCDNGKIDFAAGILANLEGRIATNILVAFDDPVLVSQIVEQMKERQPVKSARNRTGRSNFR